jgi:DNA-binding NarL/FixJ family response regulator
MTPEPNPWGLTDRQCEVVRAVAEHGCQKIAARVMGVETKTVQRHLEAVRERMQLRSTVQACVWWDRWERGSGVLS